MQLARLVLTPLAPLALSVGLLGSLTGCASLFGLNAIGAPSTPQTEEEAKTRNQGMVDDAMVKQYDDALVKHRANPKDVGAAVGLASKVQLLHELGVVARRKDLASTVLVSNVEAALDGVPTKTTEDETVLLIARGGVYRSAGRTAEAVTVLERAFQLTPKAGVAGALLAAYDESGAPNDQVSAVCAKARPNATTDDALFGLLFMCIKRLGREGLPFPTAKADLAFYDADTARQDAENRVRDREEEAARERRFAEMDARRAESQESGGGARAALLRRAAEATPSASRTSARRPCASSSVRSPSSGAGSVVITSGCTGFAKR